MKKSAVIDTASLVYLNHLHKRKSFFKYLYFLFDPLYIPKRIVEEFAKGVDRDPHRDTIIRRLNPDQGFYRFCNTYDTFVMVSIENYPGIDSGEAEVYAQFRKVNAQLIISDDKPFIQALQRLDSTIQVYTTIHLICWLEHSKLIPDWSVLIKELNFIRPFKSKELREIYIEVSKNLGVPVSKKELSKKCSMSKML